MKKRNKTNQPVSVPIQNPVAKFAAQFNKAVTFKDKTKYSRHHKHNKQEAWPIVLQGMIGQAPCAIN